MDSKAFLSDGSSKIEFTFCDGPMDEPGPAAEAFSALGLALTSWARLEHQMDALLVRVNNPEHSPDHYREHPVALKQKLTLLKRWFQRHPPLAPFAADLVFICDRIADMNREHRVLWTHSIFQSFDPATGRLVFRGMKHDRAGDIHVRTSETTLEIVRAVVNMINSTNRFLWSISSQVMQPDFDLSAP